MKVQLLWYNPTAKIYQTGDRNFYKKVLSRSDEPERFVLIQKFLNLSERAMARLNSQINALNNLKSSNQLIYK